MFSLFFTVLVISLFLFPTPLFYTICLLLMSIIVVIMIVYFNLILTIVGLVLVVVYLGAIIVVFGYVGAVLPNPIIQSKSFYTYIFVLIVFLCFYLLFLTMPITNNNPLIILGEYLFTEMGVVVFFLIVSFLFLVLLMVTSGFSINAPFRSTNL